MDRNSSDQSCSFEEAFELELNEIDAGRILRFGQSAKSTESGAGSSHDTGMNEQKNESNNSTVYGRANRADLVGLAFSGGGIRSATFNLGVLQGLSDFGLLKWIDYLSTVSGGGYIGSWFTLWIKREGISEVEAGLSPKPVTNAAPAEHKRIKFLRRFSNYLTPRIGLLTADTWTLVAAYIRNLTLNLAILASFLIALLLLPDTVVWTFKTFFSNTNAHPMLIFAAGALFFSAMTVICINLEYLSSNQPPSGYLAAYLNERAIVTRVVIPIVIFSLLASYGLWQYQDRVVGYKIVYISTIYLVYLLSWLLAIYLVEFQSESRMNLENIRLSTVKAYGRFRRRVKNWRLIVWQALGMIIAVILGSLLVGLLITTLPRDYDLENHWYVITWGMPVMLLVLMAAATLQIGLTGRDLPEQGHEWWSRLGGLFFIYTFIWVGLFSIILYGLNILNYVNDKILLSSGSGLTVAGLLAGKSPLTGGRTSKRWMEVIARVAPYVFVIGVLILLSYVTRVYLFNPRDVNELMIKYFTNKVLFLRPDYRELGQMLFLIAIYSVVALLLSWRVDINKFSLNLVYRNRLVRCYLGASNPNRKQNKFTGFDPADDENLCTLRPLFQDARYDAYAGPYPLINATLNLVDTKELAWQERKAASFVFNPLYSGYQIGPSGCYCRTEEYGEAPQNEKNPYEAKPRGLLLGTAMSISGAAASPNMGYHSSPPIAFLMTLFNIRLGWWCGNPRDARAWRKGGPNIGLKYLLSELFGRTNEDQKFVYVSDGGHFENLGIYELVRRRCRYIVACDGGQDKDLTFGDLGNAIRKCYADFGVEIEIDINKIKKKKDSKYSEAYCAIGTIHYERIDSRMKPGLLIYIKPTLTDCDTEPADVKEYATRQKDFPHQSTTDQWFDESQFESYRKLGHYITLKFFEPIKNMAGSIQHKDLVFDTLKNK